MSDRGVGQQMRAGLVVPVIGAVLLGTAGYYTVHDNRHIEQTRDTVINPLPTPTPTATPAKKHKKKRSGGQ